MFSSTFPLHLVFLLLGLLLSSCYNFFLYSLHVLTFLMFWLLSHCGWLLVESPSQSSAHSVFWVTHESFLLSNPLAVFLISKLTSHTESLYLGLLHNHYFSLSHVSSTLSNLRVLGMLILNSLSVALVRFPTVQVAFRRTCAVQISPNFLLWDLVLFSWIAQQPWHLSFCGGKDFP